MYLQTSWFYPLLNVGQGEKYTSTICSVASNCSLLVHDIFSFGIVFILIFMLRNQSIIAYTIIVSDKQSKHHST